MKILISLIRPHCLFLISFVIAAGCGDDVAPETDLGVVDQSISCTSSETRCEDGCVDVLTAHDHCGACNKTCGSAEDCVVGSCVAACPNGQVVCSARCVSTDTDVTSCGACDHSCAAGQLCSEGQCAASCAAGYLTCTGDGGVGACANPISDNANCGACGNVCGAGEACTAGHCATTCGGSTTQCAFDGGAPYCATLQSDPANCGACGHACTATEACVTGTCASICVGSGSVDQSQLTANGITSLTPTGSITQTLTVGRDGNLIGLNLGLCRTTGTVGTVTLTVSSAAGTFDASQLPVSILGAGCSDSGPLSFFPLSCKTLSVGAVVTLQVTTDAPAGICAPGAIPGMNTCTNSGAICISSQECGAVFVQSIGGNTYAGGNATFNGVVQPNEDLRFSTLLQ